MNSLRAAARVMGDRRVGPSRARHAWSGRDAARMQPRFECDVCGRSVRPEQAALAVDPARALRRPPARWRVGHPGCLWRAGAFYQLDPVRLLDPQERRYLEAHLETKRWWPGTCDWKEALRRPWALVAVAEITEAEGRRRCCG